MTSDLLAGLIGLILWVLFWGLILNAPKRTNASVAGALSLGWRPRLYHARCGRLGARDRGPGAVALTHPPT